jgi:hypothetical protein
MRTLLTLLLLAAPAFAQKTTASDVKKEAKETVDASKRYANEKKEEFEARIDARVQALKNDVTALKEKTKDKADATVTDLESKAQKAEGKLAEVKKASGSAWSKLRGGVESAVDELEKGVQSAKSK